jgi:excisionase family DNA binding protein
MNTAQQSSPAISVAFQINRVAQMLDVSRSTVYRLVRDKHLTLVKVGKRGSRVTAESVAELLRARQPSDAS